MSNTVHCTTFDNVISLMQTENKVGEDLTVFINGNNSAVYF